MIYQPGHCCIASYLCYHPLLSELRFYFVIDKILIIYSIRKMVGVNMNHFDAQAHVHIHNTSYAESVILYIESHLQAPFDLS